MLRDLWGHLAPIIEVRAMRDGNRTFMCAVVFALAAADVLDALFCDNRSSAVADPEARHPRFYFFLRVSLRVVKPLLPTRAASAVRSGLERTPGAIIHDWGAHDTERAPQKAFSFHQEQDHQNAEVQTVVKSRSAVKDPRVFPRRLLTRRLTANIKWCFSWRFTSQRPPSITR